MARADALQAFNATGAKAISAIEADVWVNPASSAGLMTAKNGTIDIVSIGVPMYTLTFTLLEADHAQANGSRSYGVCVMDTRGAAMLACERITATLTSNVWTRVRLRMNAAGGMTGVVRFGDTTVLTRSMAAYTDTQATMSVGLATRQNTNDLRMRYDTIVGTVTRVP